MRIATITREQPFFRKALVPALSAWALVFLMVSASAAPARTAESDGASRQHSAPTRFGLLVKAFTSMFFPGKSVKVVSAHANRGEAGDELEIPADPYRDGRDKPNKLTAGNRALRVAWKGGEPPFRLWLLRKSDDPAKPPRAVHSGPPVQTRTTVLPPLDLTPGRYVLIIKDKRDYAANPVPLEACGGGADCWTQMDLEIVPEAQRPADMPKDFFPSAPESLRYPTWLANQGDGEWSLEAMRLAPPADESPEAAEWQSQWGGE